MANLNFNLNIPFPYFKFSEDVKYAEVKKPSGISYILLVLFNESKDRTQKITDVLLNFGIPKSLHYLFQEEIRWLVEHDIITINYDAYGFTNLKIEDVQFTNQGRKIFAEESLPTGVYKDTRIPIYYDAVRKEFMLTMNNGVSLRKSLFDILNENFFLRFQEHKIPEDYLNLHKGERWKTKLNGGNDYITIKKEEIIVNVEEKDEPEYFEGLHSCIASVIDQKISFKFDDPIIQKFFDQYYDCSVLNALFNNSSKFKTDISYTPNIDIKDFDNYEGCKFLIPNDFVTELKRDFKFSVTKGNYHCKNGLAIEQPNAFDSINSTFEIMVLDRNNEIYAYAPCLMNLYTLKDEQINVPLVAKVPLAIQYLQKATKDYVATLTTYSDETLSLLVKITNFTKDVELAKSILNAYMSDDLLENVHRLILCFDNSLDCVELSDYLKEILSKNYYNLLDSIDSNNCESILKITRRVPTILNLKKEQVIQQYHDKLKDGSDLYLYELFVNNGFEPTLAALYFNPVKDVLNGSQPSEKNLLYFLHFDKTLNKLKDMLNVKSLNDYKINDESFDNIEFTKLFKELNNYKKYIELFSNNNTELFNEYKIYINVFTIVNDDINMRREASKSPDKINKGLLEQKINSGDYRGYFAYLAVKLEYLLKKQYETKGNALFELLDSVKGIDRTTLNDLHKFREARNSYLHYDSKIEFEPNDLRKWNDLIFSLEAKK